jgi:hypothetical protein
MKTRVALLGRPRRRQFRYSGTLAAVKTRLAAVLLLPLLAACAAPELRGGPAPPAAIPAQGVRGTLTHAGRPLAGATVYAYRRQSANFLGPADFASAPSGRDGSYVLDLVEGSYWLVARRRASGSDAGPLLPGDLQRVHPGNPVTVVPGAFTVVDLELEQMRDLLLSRAGPRGPTDTGIRGRITDAAGAPVAWVFAFAYAGEDMRRVPDFTSALTGEDGRYEIHLPAGGRYRVGARAHIREKPAPGELFGLYEGSPDHAVEVATGAFAEGVDVVLRPFGQ